MNDLKPFLRTKSLVQTKEALYALANADDVPERFRIEARQLLEHYLTLQEIEQIHKAMPEMLGPTPPFRRIQKGSQTLGIIDATKSRGG